MAIGRRTVLIGALSGAAGLTGLGRAARAFASEAQGLSLYHLHTAEALRIVYREHGALVDGALDEINYFLRDFRNDTLHSIDVALLDELSRLYDTFDGRGRFEVISGYRSPQTNESLRNHSAGVAKNSFHLMGRAIDVRLTSAKTDRLRDAAIALHAGGVGYYADSNFVHIDTGQFRTW